MNYSIPVKKFVVLTNTGATDTILVCFDAPEEDSPYPALKHPALAKIETANGYGLEWLKKFWNPNPELIEVIDLKKQ